MISKSEIIEKLELGEDSFTEFKEIKFKDARIIGIHSMSMAAEIVAFANTEGGIILFGVNDQGDVTGIPKEAMKTLEEWIANICQNNCDPPIRPAISKIMLPDSQKSNAAVLLLEVPKSVFVHQTKDGRFFHRIGSKKEILSTSELARLMQARGQQIIFDEQVLREASLADIDLEKVFRFTEPHRISQEQLLVNLGVVGKENGQYYPTVAGMLLFGIDPQRFLRSAYIEAAVYRDIYLDSDNLIHAVKITGTLDNQIEEAVRFVKRFMKIGARKEAGRIDYPQFSIKAVHEAIVNAAAHRDYSIRGSKIRLFIFDDRLELYSPGKLPNTITLENIAYRQFTRNELLVSFLSKIKSEETGIVFIEAMR
ncbi:MAG: putative DNA binding domain-containing protein [bacterium]|nr:putative DNA binding domain-containing protein [bacterium]